MRLHRFSLVFCLLIFLLSPVLTVSGAHLQTAGQADAFSITIQTRRQYSSTTVDLTTLVGQSTSDSAFYISCTGGETITLIADGDNPQFTPQHLEQSITCSNSEYRIGPVFTPTHPGLAYDNVTFTYKYGTQVRQLIGNGEQAVYGDYWFADLGATTAAMEMAYDSSRDLLYVTDRSNDQLLVVSPAQRQVVRRITTGFSPVGVSITPDFQKLYIANSGEWSISVIDLNTWQEAQRFYLPNLCTDTPWDWRNYCHPYEITILNNNQALLAGWPAAGNSLGGPLHRFDLQTGALMPIDPSHPNNYLQVPIIHSSADFNSAVIQCPPYGAWSIAKYDQASDTLLIDKEGGVGSVGINPNGTRIAVGHDSNYYDPNLSLFDGEFNLLERIKFSGISVLAAAFNPIQPGLVYAAESEPIIINNKTYYAVEEARVDTGIPTRAYFFPAPDYQYLNDRSFVLSKDGKWAYLLLVETNYQFPSRLVAVRLADPTYSDAVPPVTTVEPLSPVQTYTSWALHWAGSDDSSGIASYQVEYRRGASGAWVPWLQTTAHSALFTQAAPGETYAFRVSATDNAGNVEAWPGTYDAITVAASTPGPTNYLPFIEK